MADPKLPAPTGQKTSHSLSRVANADASTALLVDGQAALLPQSKNSVFTDKYVPQSFDLTLPILHYGSRGPIKPVVDVGPSRHATAVTTVSATDTDQGATLPSSNTVNPLAPTVAPVASSGLEGASIALTLGTTVNGLSGDANALATLVVSAIPLGATLSDGTHTFTASAGNTSVDVHSWNLASLAIPPTNDVNFTLSVAATAKDAEGNLSPTTTATEAVTVNPLAPTVAPVATSGLEGASIALNLGATVNGLAADANSLAPLVVSPATEAVTVNPLAPTVAWSPSSASVNHGQDLNPFALGTISYTINGLPGDSNSLQSLTISGLRVGDTISDGSHTFTASGGNTSVNVSTWTLNSLTLNAHRNPGTFTLTATATERDSEGNLSASTTATESVTVMPAGVAGSAINLALTDPSGHQDFAGAVTITGIPSGWTLNAGTSLGDGIWTVQTSDVQSLTITSPTGFSGAVLLNVSETLAQADGSTATLTIRDNVEAYQHGSPIFAWSGADTLTGSGGNDLFVFDKVIGNDTIHNFNVGTDKVDLIGFSNVASFSAIQANTADDAHGNAVITVANGESLPRQGVHDTSLAASHFVFDQTAVMDNAGSMVVSDGALLPLNGVINNTGTIALNSTGQETELQIGADGIKLEGGGHVTLSDSHENFIVGATSSATLINVDNTIIGGGELGSGQMTLVNEGTITASGSNALVIDTGANIITNSGTLEATGGSLLDVHGDVANSGLLWANGGNLTVQGDVYGSGYAFVDGSATLEFGGASSERTSFAVDATGTLKLDNAPSFTGVISGFGAGDHLDLSDIAFGTTATVSYSANL